MADDATILSVLAGLQTSVETSRTETARAIDSLRTDLTARIGEMVTRREHEAEIKRLDEADRRVARRLEGIEHQLTGVREQMEEADEKREAARAAAEERRRADRRWLVGIVLTAIATASAVTGVVVNAIGG
jgi:DNA repair exonuclease SbcCD ATPase subunit